MFCLNELQETQIPFRKLHLYLSLQQPPPVCTVQQHRRLRVYHVSLWMSHSSQSSDLDEDL